MTRVQKGNRLIAISNMEHMVALTRSTKQVTLNKTDIEKITQINAHLIILHDGIALCEETKKQYLKHVSNLNISGDCTSVKKGRQLSNLSKDFCLVFPL